MIARINLSMQDRIASLTTTQAEASVAEALLLQINSADLAIWNTSQRITSDMDKIRAGQEAGLRINGLNPQAFQDFNEAIAKRQNAYDMLVLLIGMDEVAKIAARGSE